MSEVILVVLQRLDTAPGLLRAAERLAVLAHGARVNVLAVNAAEAAALATIDGAVERQRAHAAGEKQERLVFEIGDAERAFAGPRI